MMTYTQGIDLARKEATYQASICLIKGKLPSLSSYQHHLHNSERQIFQGFKFDRRRQSYLLGRLSAKYAIGSLCDSKDFNQMLIKSGVFHFPIVSCPFVYNTEVSISHCNDIGLSVAYSSLHPIGVDVEQIDPKRKELLMSQHTPQELKAVQTLTSRPNNITYLTLLWSAKEALSKVLKTGMMLDFKLMEAKNIELNSNCIRLNFTNFPQYKAIVFYDEDYVYCIVLPKNSEVQEERIKLFFSSTNNDK